jgi:hypothetical protein
LDVKENILLSPLSDLDKGDNKKNSCFLPLDIKKNIIISLIRHG